MVSSAVSDPEIDPVTAGLSRSGEFMDVDARRPEGGDQRRHRSAWTMPTTGRNDDTDRLTEAVANARRADAAAFDEIYRALHPGLLRYLRVWVGDDAEDVASETWLQIARDLESFHGDWDRFRGWAVTIGRNRAIDHARHRKRHPDLPLEHLPERASPVDTAEAACEAIGTDAVVALLAALPREQAEAIVLRVVFALDAKACGHILGRRAGAVRTAAHRGLRELAALLNADPPTATHGAAPGAATTAVTPAADPAQLG
jgi:RNA polymerase sigma-70 factor, ECF subfamily